MKIGLVITNDWELFGDGSGDYFEIQQRPLEAMNALATKYDAKITVMAEVGQQFKHIDVGKAQFGAKAIAIAWENIMSDTVSRGSDVQLHYHPQWQASAFKIDHWELNTEKYPLISIGTKRIEEELGKGKEYLETLLQKVNPDYRCIAFRAGALCIQPSEQIIPILKKIGLKCDVSVTKNKVSPGFYDFRDAHSNIYPWFTDKSDINKESDSGEGILEIPIYSETKRDSAVMKKYAPAKYYKSRFAVDVSQEELEWEKQRDIVKAKRYPVENRFYKQHENRNLLWYMKALSSNNTVHLDYDYLPSSVFLKILDNISQQIDNEDSYNNDILPIIASGHVKDMHNPDNFKRILEGIQERFADRVEYMTLTEAVDYLYEKKNKII
ncbi:MAG: hypothetical protein PF588_06565 [Candidatus Kapabacteria bacterium]|jgi:hypothetical protein|nr:hypothetical protein [Candidatus Kapabacteria bacterium]